MCIHPHIYSELFIITTCDEFNHANLNEKLEGNTIMELS